jgi:hypothetical protein
MLEEKLTEVREAQAIAEESYNNLKDRIEKQQLEDALRRIGTFPSYNQC